jgi:hypothetical protein
MVGVGDFYFEYGDQTLPRRLTLQTAGSYRCAPRKKEDTWADGLPGLASRSFAEEDLSHTPVVHRVRSPTWHSTGVEKETKSVQAIKKTWTIDVYHASVATSGNPTLVSRPTCMIEMVLVELRQSLGLPIQFGANRRQLQNMFCSTPC